MDADKGLIFDIKRDCSEDGPGIRTTVFFKGCPLSCSWCQNPEGMSKDPGISFRAELCHPDECGAPCVSACPSQCLQFNDILQINHDACIRCDKCLTDCKSQAFEAVGQWYFLDELMYRVNIDKPFYTATNGGVTVSGGEATMQMEFLHKFLKRLKDLGIHTALETSGLFNYNLFRRLLLPYLDLIYFDIKIMDEAESIRYTGCSNKPILENFTQLIKESAIPVVPRTPLIPGITATEHNLKGIASFLRQLGIKTCTLLPYNPLGQDKMQRIGRTPVSELRHFMDKFDEQRCINYFFT